MPTVELRLLPESQLLNKRERKRSLFLLVLIQTTLFRKNAILAFLTSIGRMSMEYRITTRFGKKTTIHKVDAPNSTDAEKQLRLRRGEKIIDIERVKSSLDFDNGLGAPKYR